MQVVPSAEYPFVHSKISGPDIDAACAGVQNTAHADIAPNAAINDLKFTKNSQRAPAAENISP